MSSLKPDAARPNSCLYGPVMRKFYILIHFILAYFLVYFILLSFYDDEYMLAAMPIMCMISYVLFYIGFCVRQQLFCVPIFVLDLISIPYFILLTVHYYEPAFETAYSSVRTYHIVAFSCAIATALLKCTVFPIIYRAYSLLPYDDDFEMGMEMAIMSLVSILFPLVLACALLVFSDGADPSGCEGFCHNNPAPAHVDTCCARCGPREEEPEVTPVPGFTGLSTLV
ncbi:unnamed protein product [Bursaphelenchus xylophilus]|uniref:(pine wood nematode) hypothetical protein n=1 Tax=Bursaphelenchus xylophilus TaxID=6326 RepID=A0A1I7RIK7_BURXY|nr:unnamed protein product [Bursaphelenchus xylophilus]CAG9118853.1 unnamed protein product [Bursaphelenchus xylophilus]